MCIYFLLFCKYSNHATKSTHSILQQTHFISLHVLLELFQLHHHTYVVSARCPLHNCGYGLKSTLLLLLFLLHAHVRGLHALAPVHVVSAPTAAVRACCAAAHACRLFSCSSVRPLAHSLARSAVPPTQLETRQSRTD